jgi:ribose 5-phosphate isomerase A
MTVRKMRKPTSGTSERKMRKSTSERESTPGNSGLKKQAALLALEYVQDGMRLGLGTGSTTRLFIQALGERWQEGGLRDLACVATSEETAAQGRLLGLPLVSLADLSLDGRPPVLDLAVDGADEVDPDLNLIKGLGKAALREKMVEMHARRFVVIVDESKLVDKLGRGPLPVELVPFAWETTLLWLGSLGNLSNLGNQGCPSCPSCRAELWCDDQGQPFVTDNHNYLARLWFPGGISDPAELDRVLNQRPGVVGHGLFLGMASEVIVAAASGVQVLHRTPMEND